MHVKRSIIQIMAVTAITLQRLLLYKPYSCCAYIIHADWGMMKRNNNNCFSRWRSITGNNEYYNPLRQQYQMQQQKYKQNQYREISHESLYVYSHRINSVMLFSSTDRGSNIRNNDDDNNEKTSNNTDATNNTEDTKSNNFEPTWTYTPYKPPPPTKKRIQGTRRNFSTTNDDWIIPKSISIPEDKLEMTFERSSGAGGQNVNKVNTKVVIKINIKESTWIPNEVRQRIKQNEGNKINKDGYLILASQEYRTQGQNRKDVLDKLEDIILRNYPRPKVRKMRKGISKKAKERNKEDKRYKSEIKSNRKRVDFP